MRPGDELVSLLLREDAQFEAVHEAGGIVAFRGHGPRVAGHRQGPQVRAFGGRIGAAGAVVQERGHARERGAQAELAQEGGGVDPVVEEGVLEGDRVGLLGDAAAALDVVDRAGEGDALPAAVAQPFQLRAELGGGDAADGGDVPVR